MTAFAGKKFALQIFSPHGAGVARTRGKCLHPSLTSPPGGEEWFSALP
jgi:hypothetical protein